MKTSIIAIYDVEIMRRTLQYTPPIAGASIGSSAGFHGNGYVELPLHLLPHRSSQVEEVIEMTVTTRQPDGLLLWHGQKPNTQGRGKDYLSVAIHAGKVVFRSVGRSNNKTIVGHNNKVKRELLLLFIWIVIVNFLVFSKVEKDVIQKN